MLPKRPIQMVEIDRIGSFIVLLNALYLRLFTAPISTIYHTTTRPMAWIYSSSVIAVRCGNAPPYPSFIVDWTRLFFWVHLLASGRKVSEEERSSLLVREPQIEARMLKDTERIVRFGLRGSPADPKFKPLPDGCNRSYGPKGIAKGHSEWSERGQDSTPPNWRHFEVKKIRCNGMCEMYWSGGTSTAACKFPFPSLLMLANQGLKFSA